MPKKELKTTKKDKTEAVSGMLDSLMNQVLSLFDIDEIAENLKPEIESKLKEYFGVIPQVHQVVLPGSEPRYFKGAIHEMFDTVLNMVKLDIPVLMTGEAGTGKSTIAKQVAESLGYDFYFTNAVTQEYKLTGFIDANGNYHETQFYKAFKNGGIFFLDELDASVPEVLVILNAAIANRYFDFPIGKIEANPNFRIIAAGNTFGTGATNTYTGRYCLDAASLDRFATVHIDYSESIEKDICGNNEELLKFCRTFREITKKAHIDCIFSYRSLDRINTLESTHILPIYDILEISLLKNLDKDDRHILYNELYKVIPGNKYVAYIEKL